MQNLKHMIDELERRRCGRGGFPTQFIVGDKVEVMRDALRRPTYLARGILKRVHFFRVIRANYRL